MSSLWTPGGEHPVEPNQPAQPSQPAPAQAPPAANDAGSMPADGPMSLDDLSPEERAQAEAYAAQMAEAREQIAQTPANIVVANHAMGLYELGAIHLSENPPNFSEATVAIDALSAVLDKLQGRLGENEAVLTEALGQLQQAFVALKQQVEAEGTPPA